MHTCKLAQKPFVHGEIFTSSHPKKQELRILYHKRHLSTTTYLIEWVEERNLTAYGVPVRSRALSCNDTFGFLSGKLKGCDQQLQSVPELDSSLLTFFGKNLGIVRRAEKTGVGRGVME